MLSQCRQLDTVPVKVFGSAVDDYLNHFYCMDTRSAPLGPPTSNASHSLLIYRSQSLLVDPELCDLRLAIVIVPGFSQSRQKFQIFMFSRLPLAFP